MRRREFIAGLGAAAWPAVARAQQPTKPVIGFLQSASPTTTRPGNLAGFQQGLAEIGFIEGRNVAIEYRWAEGRNDALPALAADLVRHEVAVIVTMSTVPCALAAKAATQTIPVVFMIGADPVEFGLVVSLSRPGGNLTGVSTLAGATAAKRFQLLHEVIPRADPIAVLVNPTNVANEAKEIANSAGILGVRLLVLNATRASDIEVAFDKLVAGRAGALVVAADPLFYTLRDEIAAQAMRHAIPTIDMDRVTALAGGLMSYGPDVIGTARIVGTYAGRILKGAKSSDLPVQLSTKLELVINLKTARGLGLTVPQGLIALADEVIE
jgi:putative tryptophan/tyrosine transport system substrate-binding protein